MKDLLESLSAGTDAALCVRLDGFEALNREIGNREIVKSGIGNRESGNRESGNREIGNIQEKPLLR